MLPKLICYAVNTLIKLAEQTISIDELEALSKWILKNEKLTKGPITKQFEQVFSDYIGNKFSIYVNSGSSANLLIAQALKLSGKLRNDRVILPAVSWVTTVTPFLQLGFDARLCDCSSTDLGLDISSLEEMITEFDPALVVLVNVLGHSNDIVAIRALCESRGILLVEDSCEALGSESGGRKLGCHGIAGSFSFYYGHHISTIEGGMVVTDDQDLWNLMKSIRSHGWGRDVDCEILDSWKTVAEIEVDEFRNLYTFYHSGFNLRSTDLQAFLGLSQLKKLPAIGEARVQNFELYKARLGDYFVQSSCTEFLSSFAYGTLVSDPLKVGSYLKKHEVESRPLICGNIGRHPFWIREQGLTLNKKADVVHDHGIYLPNHHLLSEVDINRVCDLFLQIAEPKFFNQ